jgi:hypothetical protein
VCVCVCMCVYVCACVCVCVHVCVCVCMCVCVCACVCKRVTHSQSSGCHAVGGPLSARRPPAKLQHKAAHCGHQIVRRVFTGRRVCTVLLHCHGESFTPLSLPATRLFGLTCKAAERSGRSAAWDPGLCQSVTSQKSAAAAAAAAGAPGECCTQTLNMGAPFDKASQSERAVSLQFGYLVYNFGRHLSCRIPEIASA